MYWYATFLVQRPYITVFVIALVCLACVTISLFTRPLPDFNEPTLGFEARGTEIGKRLAAWQNLLHKTSSLFSNPSDLFDYQKYNRKEELNFSKAHWNRKLTRNHRRKARRRKKQKQNKDNIAKIQRIKAVSYGNEFKHSSVIQSNAATNGSIEASIGVFEKIYNYDPAPRTNDETYFCGAPNRDYAHLVIERISPNETESLFDLNALLAMCQLQNQLTAVKGYSNYCQKHDFLLENDCCRPWSLSNYVALLSNKSSCFDLNNDDVSKIQKLLLDCSKYFLNLKLGDNCNEYTSCYAPMECTRNNAIFNILHYLTDVNFIKTNTSKMYLKYAMLFVPVAKSADILSLFHDWEKLEMQNEIVQVAAMDLGLENALFNECLLTDGWLIGLGGIFVMTCIWLYTLSVFVTMMTCIAIIFSLGLSYFIYTLIFEMSFFPFMNLLAVVVIIGIGADDSFIFIKLWQSTQMERFNKTSIDGNTTAVAEYTKTLPNIMSLVLRHAALSMFVTSLTTAVAFYASYTSSITSIKCFGIFAGTTVMANYMLMITWLPATIVIMERFPTWNLCGQLQSQKLFVDLKRTISKFGIILDNIILGAIMNYATLWVSLFALIGVCAAVIVLYKPGLQLPDTPYFQLFVSEHPFEIYASKLKHEFWFEKSMAIYDNFKLPLRFVWGVQAIDDGDYKNPYLHGKLHYDNNFNISTKAAQVWLLDFCQRIKHQPFYQLTFGVLLPNCFIENFISYMNRMCVDSMDGTDRTPCCDISSFPYEPHIFELCLPQSISSLYATPREFFIPGVAGPKFFATPYYDDQQIVTAFETNKQKPNVSLITPPLVKALVVEFESNVSVAASYQEVKQFVENTEQWFVKELSTAPYEMQGGWFISELQFYDVQYTLAHGTLIAIALAMLSSFVVLLTVTLNLLISLFSVITVTLSIFTTVAGLIMFGWKLNILESIAVSTAIGLAVDFSLHYGIHYRLSPQTERIAATQFAIKRILGPTIMTAATTILAGVLMLFSSVLPYIQIGLFLVVVTSVSWIYATFFLMSLLKIAGPQNGFMQFYFPRLCKLSKSSGIKYCYRKERKIIVTEHLFSGIEPVISESHELNSVANSNSIIKEVCGNECSSVVNITDVKQLNQVEF